jgi:hypothetical protein
MNLCQRYSGMSFNSIIVLFILTAFQATFLILKKLKEAYDIPLLSVCLCILPIKFWTPEPLFMKLGVYIMAPKPVSTTYGINPYHQSACLYEHCCSVHTFPWQRIHATIVLLDASFPVCPYSIKWESVGLSEHTPIVARQRFSMQFPVQRIHATIVLLDASFPICPCSIKWESVDLSVHPPIVARQRFIIHFPAAKKNCWRRFLCGPRPIKGK